MTADSEIIRQIKLTPSTNRIWNKLSEGGKRRVLHILNGSIFMMAETLEDVALDEKDEREAIRCQTVTAK